METEELTRLVDEIYKNILDKFNPGARQLINAGKAYLKALHGAAAASRVYVDALSRLARQAQLGTWGGSKDVGFALMRIVEVYKEIQEQEMNILKAFYVDLLVPLETNLEKDTKVIQSEQKKFLQQHKTRSETYSKAAATMKKQRKKSRGASKSGLAMDKELKNMQILEEEKSKLDAFCEQSLKNAMTQERRRYGFVLERQCSLAKHYASFHEVALAALHPSVEKWREVAATREYLPQFVEDMFASRLRQVSFWPEDEENGGSDLTMSSQLRKTRSMDSSCLELRLSPPPNQPLSTHQGPPLNLPAILSRARSEVNLHASTLSLGPEIPETPSRPRSMAPPVSRNSSIVQASGNQNNAGIISGGWADAPLARALFAYLSSGENQLSFLEGDLIALMGDRQKGWQFGENLRTQSSGWFPLAYAEIILDESLGSPNHGTRDVRTPEPTTTPPCKSPPSRPPVPTNSSDELSSGLHDRGKAAANNNGISNNEVQISLPNNNSIHNLTTPTTRQSKSIRPLGTLPSALANGRRTQPPIPSVPPPQAMASLHSSNDSGFSNEPPVQPDVDYSDDEVMRQRRRRPRVERNLESVKPLQQQQQQANEDKGTNAKDWETDSWKTIPQDAKSWHLYKTAMDLWAEANMNQDNDIQDTDGYSSTNRRLDIHQQQGSREFSKRNGTNQVPSKKREKNSQQKAQQNECEPRSRPNPNQRNKYESNETHLRNSIRRETQQITEQNRREINKRMKSQEETEEDELEIEKQKQDEETYGPGAHYEEDYYGNRVGEQDRNSIRGYNAVQREETKYDDEKSSTSSPLDSEEESTITIPEVGRKVEHIAQKLEQTAQKYAREHSPPKFPDRRHDYKSLERSREEKKQLSTNYERYNEREKNKASHPYEGERYREKSPLARENILTYEKERTFEKNPDRNRIVERRSSRRFERPKPPSEEAPERPTERREFFKDPRYLNKKETIYGETGGYVRDSQFIEKERGYESNFETKLERNKVLERHGAYKNTRMESSLEGHIRKSDKNVTNSFDRSEADDNTLRNDKKPLLPRQSTAVGHLIQTGRVFDMDTKSPKMVKRTKSFWRFRRDSDVLEGMALWQHRSLVDIPKMIRKETHDEKENVEKISKYRNTESSLDFPDHEALLLKNTDIRELTVATNEPMSKRQEEPKPAERSYVPDKPSEFLEDFPTPAERSKIVDRTEHKMHHEERSYFVGNVSRKAIIEKERKRSLEAKRNMIVAELKENNEAKKNERRKKVYGDDDDGLLQNYTETEASDEESTYSCIIVKDQAVQEKTFLPRTKLRKNSERETDKNACGPWYDLWGADSSVNKKKKKQQ